METLPERIAYLRNASGLTQERFGKEVGFSDAFVCMLESGKRGLGYEKARGAAERCGTTVAWLLAGEGRPPSKRKVASAFADARARAATDVERTKGAA